MVIRLRDLAPSGINSRMKLPDTTRDHLMHASASWEAVDAMETFSNGLSGHYHYIKYVVVRNQGLWTNTYDVAIALHVEQWNFGLEDGKQLTN